MLYFSILWPYALPGKCKYSSIINYSWLQQHMWFKYLAYLMLLSPFTPLSFLSPFSLTCLAQWLVTSASSNMINIYFFNWDMIHIPKNSSFPSIQFSGFTISPELFDVPESLLDFALIFWGWTFHLGLHHTCHSRDILNWEAGIEALYPNLTSYWMWATPREGP